MLIIIEDKKINLFSCNLFARITPSIAKIIKKAVEWIPIAKAIRIQPLICLRFFDSHIVKVQGSMRL